MPRKFKHKNSNYKLHFDIYCNSLKEISSIVFLKMWKAFGLLIIFANFCDGQVYTLSDAARIYKETIHVLEIKIKQKDERIRILLSDCKCRSDMRQRQMDESLTMSTKDEKKGTISEFPKAIESLKTEMLSLKRNLSSCQARHKINLIERSLNKIGSKIVENSEKEIESLDSLQDLIQPPAKVLRDYSFPSDHFDSKFNEIFHLMETGSKTPSHEDRRRIQKASKKVEDVLYERKRIYKELSKDISGAVKKIDQVLGTSINDKENYDWVSKLNQLDFGEININIRGDETALQKLRENDGELEVANRDLVQAIHDVSRFFKKFH